MLGEKLLVEIKGREATLSQICRKKPLAQVAAPAKKEDLLPHLLEYSRKGQRYWKNRWAVLYLDENEVFYRKLALPPFKKWERESGAYYFLHSEFPFLADQMDYDYQCSSDEDGLYVEVLAARKETVAQYLAIFQKAGLDILFLGGKESGKLNLCCQRRLVENKRCLRKTVLSVVVAAMMFSAVMYSVNFLTAFREITPLAVAETAAEPWSVEWENVEAQRELHRQKAEELTVFLQKKPSGAAVRNLEVTEQGIVLEGEAEAGLMAEWFSAASGEDIKRMILERYEVKDSLVAFRFRWE